MQALCVLFMLAGCGDGQPLEMADGEEILDDLPQPKVQGIEGTILQSAQAAEEAGDYRRAAQFYGQLKDAYKKKVPYQLAFAENNRRAGENDIALNVYDRILKKNPNNLDALEGKALAQMAKGEFTEAGDLFSKVMSKDKKRWRTLNGLGILFIGKELNEEAMAYFMEALENSHNNIGVMNNIGLTFAINQQMDEAIDTLKQASALAPKGMLRKQVDMNLALVYGITGDLGAAEKIASKYLDGPPLNNNLGLYAHLAKDDVLAKSYLNMALTKSPRYYERAWENLSGIELRENKATQKGKHGERVKVN